MDASWPVGMSQSRSDQEGYGHRLDDLEVSTGSSGYVASDCRCNPRLVDPSSGS